VLAVDDRHVAFCEYNGSVARIICVAVATLANENFLERASGNPTTYAYQCFDSNHFHILIVFKPICFRGHTYFICFSLLSILVFNTISISDDIYVVKVVTVKALISICCWISVLMHRNFTICGR
jgi:hypothetical protein